MVPEMTITRQIHKAGRINRRRQTLSELRIDEQLLLEVARAQLNDEWTAADEMGDDRFVRFARAHYATLTTDEQRDSMAKVFAEWSRDEVIEDRLIANARQTNLQTIVTFKRNTPAFVDGAFVPGGSDGAA
jgi:hypothetical protein